MKRLYEALFLGFAVLALAQSSGIWFLGIFFLLWIAVGFALHRQKKTPNYKKAVAYAMILPFALWWFLSPNTRGHFFSPWLFVIPSWYFMSLAILQWQSSGKGGFPVFFRFNALFALLFSLHATDKISASFLRPPSFCFSASSPKDGIFSLPFRFCFLWLRESGFSSASRKLPTGSDIVCDREIGKKNTETNVP